MTSSGISTEEDFNGSTISSHDLARIAAPLYSLDLIMRILVYALLGLGLAVLIDRRRAARKQRQQARMIRTVAAS